jgi:hypothetical protein
MVVTDADLERLPAALVQEEGLGKLLAEQRQDLLGLAIFLGSHGRASS